MANLEVLAMGNNQLTGALPPQLGGLTKSAVSLGIAERRPRRAASPGTHANLIAGFLLGKNQPVCAAGSCISGLAGEILNHDGGRSCTLPPPEVFSAFYEATGGPGWTSNANWLTDAPVSSWFGVIVEDSLVTAVELPGNGLSGTVPPAVGTLWI